MDLKRKVAGYEIHGAANEFEMFSEIIDRAMVEKTQMHALVAEQKLMLLNYIVNNLLAGSEVSDQELSLWESNFAEKRFFVATAYGLKLDNLSRNAAVSHVEKTAKSHVYIADMPHENHIAFLCVLDKDATKEQTLDALGGALKKYDAHVTLGVGEEAENPQKIRDSYISSLKVEDYDPVDLLVIDAEADSTDGQSDRWEELLSFMRYMQSGESEQALLCLDKLAMRIEHSTATYNMKRYACNCIISKYIHVLKQMDMVLGHQELSQMINFVNVEEAFASIKNSAARLCDAIKREKQNQKDSFVKGIVDYVDRNYASEQTTLMQVGDQFNLSIYTLCRIFKEATGIGFKEYITKKRLDQGRHLLLTTDMSIKEIAKSIGFYNADYFSKLFKARFGVTPSALKDENLL